MNKTNATLPFDTAIKPLTQNLRQVLQRLPNDIKENVQEIRLRSCRALTIQTFDRSMYVSTNSKLTYSINDDTVIVGQNDILNSFHSICNYSVYSHQNEIKNGFITIKGGHRVGIAGVAVINDDKIVNIRDISSMNIRIAREVIGVADELLFKLKQNLSGTLIAGSPSCGKTTLLRDIARSISYKVKVCVIDERGELASIYGGTPQNDLGQCDILTGYPKAKGILQAIRCLSPDIIICDEIGSEEEVRSIEQGLNAGVGLIASIHCGSMEELRHKIQMKRLIDIGAFYKVVLMGNSHKPGVIRGIYKIGEMNA